MRESAPRLARTFLKIEVFETTDGRAYWLAQEWAQSARSSARDADVVILPWVNFREGEQVTFPSGTVDLFRSLRDAGVYASIAVDEERYNEIALHSFQTRWPLILVSAFALPLLANVVSDHVNRLVEQHGANTPVAIEVIVEGERGACIHIRYEGPAEELPTQLLEQTKRCLPQVTADAKPKPTNLTTKRQIAESN